MAAKKDDPSIIEKISSYLVSPFRKGPPPKTPIEGFGERFKNMMKNNFRGIIGVIVPLFALTWQVKRFDPQIKLLLMWQWMFWFYLVQPIGVPCTSMIPIFVLPMAGIYESLYTCKCYMNEGIMLYITSAYLVVLLNNSGIDKRFAFWILCSGSKNHYSGKMLVLKASTAAFFLSMFSSRLIAAYQLIQTMTNALDKIDTKKSTKKPVQGSADITAMRYIINNAIQTSSSIGGLGILHSSWVTLLFRACYLEYVPKGYENPEIFNYLQYSVFAFPIAFIMFILNLIYHIMLMKSSESDGLAEPQLDQLSNIFLRDQAEIPKTMSLHEMYSVIFAILLLVILFTRTNRFMGGWGASVEKSDKEPLALRVKDTTVTAIFVILLHIIPKSFGFLKIFNIQQRRDIPVFKPESAVLWWRFVDKSVNYGYLFTFGSAIALLRASSVRKLNLLLVNSLGAKITDQSWDASIFICILISAILCNVMSAMAACAVFLPYMLTVADIGRVPWPSQFFLPALGIGLACNLGFCSPFQYTPAYYCHHTGKVPILTMVKYSIPSIVIGILVIFFGVRVYAPVLFDPNNTGVTIIPVDMKLTTTQAPVKEAAPEGEPGEREET